jgi:hypothetical protein
MSDLAIGQEKNDLFLLFFCMFFFSSYKLEKRDFCKTYLLNGQ